MDPVHVPWTRPPHSYPHMGGGSIIFIHKCGLNYTVNSITIQEDPIAIRKALVLLNYGRQQQGMPETRSELLAEI